MERAVRFMDALDDNATEHYNTYADFNCILSAFSFPPPEAKTYTVEIPGADGSIDLSTALTDGETVYNDRQGTITLILIGRWKRNLHKITNVLHGRKFYFNLPDDDWWYYGRISVTYDSVPAYAVVTLTCKCDPWKYAKDLTTYVFNLSTTPVTKKILNSGRRKAVPTITVSDNTTLTLTDGSTTLNGLTGGSTYLLAEYPIDRNGLTLTATGTASGRAVLIFREAVL